jgi:catechol 2,3-dioxygenase-like lactoylglutathione lyase family enzyme
MTILGIDHVQMAAPSGSEETARHFYGRLLGLAELANPEALQSRGGVWFQLGKQQLHIGIAESFVPAQKAHPALAVSPDGLSALAETLAHAGVVVTWDDSLPGRRGSTWPILGATAWSSLPRR